MTVNVFPATVRVPERDDVEVFAVAEKETEPVPEPFDPAVTVSQVTLLAAVQAQPVSAVTETVPVDAADPSDADVEPRL